MNLVRCVLEDVEEDLQKIRSGMEPLENRVNEFRALENMELSVGLNWVKNFDADHFCSIAGRLIVLCLKADMCLGLIYKSDKPLDPAVELKAKSLKGEITSSIKRVQVALNAWDEIYYSLGQCKVCNASGQ